MAVADRRIGIVVLLTAVLALIAVNRISGRDIPGEAVAIGLPPIPAVGSCLDTRTEPPNAVDCRERHTAEVYQSWREGQPPADISDRCASGRGSRTWALSRATDWTAPQLPTLSTEVSDGRTLGWEACVLTAAVDMDPARPLSYLGSLSRTPTDAPSAAIGACFLDRQRQVDCTSPHTIERVGEFWGSDERKPAHSCAEYARDVVGTGAFEGSAALQVVNAVDRSGWVSMLDSRTGQSMTLQTCNVVAPRNLVDSVVGLGTRPLPFA